MNKSKNRQVTAKRAAPAVRSEEPVTPEVPTGAEKLASINEKLQGLLSEYMQLMPEAELSTADRRRLQGSGVRRYGFIDKVHDVAESNPDFVPGFLDLAVMEAHLREIETMRNITVTLTQFARVNNDRSLLVGNETFRLALLFYQSVRAAARRYVPGASGIFEMLQKFFRRPKNASDTPTEADIKHDVNALLHGKKEGKIVIENKLPGTVKGKRIIIDETEKKKQNSRKQMKRLKAMNNE